MNKLALNGDRTFLLRFDEKSLKRFLCSVDSSLTDKNYSQESATDIAFHVFVQKTPDGIFESEDGYGCVPNCTWINMKEEKEEFSRYNFYGLKIYLKKYDSGSLGTETEAELKNHCICLELKVSADGKMYLQCQAYKNNQLQENYNINKWRIYLKRETGYKSIKNIICFEEKLLSLATEDSNSVDNPQQSENNQLQENDDNNKGQITLEQKNEECVNAESFTQELTFITPEKGNSVYDQKSDMYTFFMNLIKRIIYKFISSINKQNENQSRFQNKIGQDLYNDKKISELQSNLQAAPAITSNTNQKGVIRN